MRLGNAIRLLKLAGFKHYAFNLPPRPDGLDTSDLEVLVKHPVHGKCPAIRIPIFPREDQRMLDWEVTGDLVTLVINQFRPPVTARRERAEEGEAAQAEVAAVKEAPARKEAPAARTGDVGTAEASVADTRGEASVGQAAKAREAVAAETDVATPLSASTATASEIAAPEGLPLPPSG